MCAWGVDWAIKMKLLFVILMFLALFFSCSNSLDDMVDDYNGGFTKDNTETEEDSAEETLYPGDDGYDQTEMLFEQYFLASDETLNLFAPSSKKSATEYSWTLTQPSDTSKGSNFAVLFQGTTYTSRRFVLYVPESTLEEGTYKLVLTVETAGKSYTDSCAIIIYESIR